MNVYFVCIYLFKTGRFDYIYFHKNDYIFRLKGYYIIIIIIIA